ncbi:MAG: class I SAM-dependent methyltransferase [Proteobacteria bacterium]|nr:class I SAM-dependent methyltransferase [Pseudomonadota bacterium]
MNPDDAANRAYYDAFSERYDRGRNLGYHRMVDDLEFDVVEPYAKGKRVLEAGCGTGLLLARLNRVAQSAWGVDLSAGMARGAQDRGLNVVLGSLTRLPFRDGAFDLVCSFKVLPHVQQVRRALAEITRVTIPRGYIVVEFYNPWSLRYLAKRLAGPRSTSSRRTEADVFTRWDAPWSLRDHLPPNVEMVALRGVRVLTPTAAVYRSPVLARFFFAMEHKALSSRIRYFGGFLIAVLRKQARPLARGGESAAT